MAATTGAFAAVDQIIETAVNDGVVPGAVILCADEGTTSLHRAFGARELEPQWREATNDTVYDIASVTKAVSTTVLVMKAVGSGFMELDDPVSRHLPEFSGPGKDAVTVRHLLCHASGLPAHRPFHETTSDVARAAAAEPLINAPGAVSVYSDLGFILLGWMMERLMGSPLDDLFRMTVSEPLGLASTGFVNLGERGAPGLVVADHPVAPTENSAVRGCLVKGEVDDLNAFAMGGVAGHAGLFSDAAGLATIASALVDSWHGKSTHVRGGKSKRAKIRLRAGSALRRETGFALSREVIREFWRPAGIDGSTWRLGWDGPASRHSQAGELLSRQAVGHLGFTGCSLWIDPERALWIVLLTNRVHPKARPDPRFRLFRAAVHDAMLAALRA